MIVAHAAKADKVVEAIGTRKFSRFTTLRSTDGELLDPADHSIVKVAGHSLDAFGIHNDNYLVVRSVDFRPPAELLPLHKGQIVLVDAPAGGSNVRHRLRAFSHWEGREASFIDAKKRYRNRPASEIVGIVTHKLPPR